MRLFRDIVEITMPNRAITSCIAFMAGMIISDSFDLFVLFFGMLMIICTYSSQAVFNNIRDIEGDKVNAPHRPLASGSLSVRFATVLMACLIIMGIVFAYLASPFLLLVNFLYVILGVLYSIYTKSRWLFSYFTLVTSHIIVPLISGYLIFGVLDIRIMLVVAFVYLTEVLAFSLKDYKDIEGDRKMGMRTLPVVFDRHAVKITAAGLILPLLLVWIPWKMLQLSFVFLSLYLIAGLIRSVFAVRLMKSSCPHAATDMLKTFRYILILEMGAWCLS